MQSPAGLYDLVSTLPPQQQNPELQQLGEKQLAPTEAILYVKNQLDRLRAARQPPPPTTVMQDMQQQLQQAQMSQQQPPMQRGPPPQQGPMQQGLPSLPVQNVGQPQNYVGGGIVAFANRGFVGPVQPDVAAAEARINATAQVEREALAQLEAEAAKQGLTGTAKQGFIRQGLSKLRGLGKGTAALTTGIAVGSTINDVANFDPTAYGKWAEGAGYQLDPTKPRAPPKEGGIASTIDRKLKQFGIPDRFSASAGPLKHDTPELAHLRAVEAAKAAGAQSTWGNFMGHLNPFSGSNESPDNAEPVDKLEPSTPTAPEDYSALDEMARKPETGTGGPGISAGDFKHKSAYDPELYNKQVEGLGSLDRGTVQKEIEARNAAAGIGNLEATYKKRIAKDTEDIDKEGSGTLGKVLQAAGLAIAGSTGNVLQAITKGTAAGVRVIDQIKDKQDKLEEHRQQNEMELARYKEGIAAGVISSTDSRVEKAQGEARQIRREQEAARLADKATESTVSARVWEANKQAETSERIARISAENRISPEDERLRKLHRYMDIANTDKDPNRRRQAEQRVKQMLAQLEQINKSSSSYMNTEAKIVADAAKNFGLLPGSTGTSEVEAAANKILGE